VTKEGITYFFTYHPAAILRNPGLRQVFLADLAKLAELIKSGD
jgi:uracil-DNA glycosylase